MFAVGLRRILVGVMCGGPSSGGEFMNTRHRSTHLGSEWAILLAVILGTPAWVCAAEPLETIREAFRVSSQGLTSGAGKGVYRHYRAIGTGDWQLMQDADLTASFDGRKYHIDSSTVATN